MNAFYVRHRGEIRGPIDVEKLRSLAAAGKLKPFHELAPSAEGPWTRADRLLPSLPFTSHAANETAPAEGVPAATPAPALHDAFISHSSKDKLSADAVCSALESRGIRCWVAPRDIAPGANWGEAIIDGLSHSRVVILILSQHANVSPQVMREVERAVSKGIPIVPLRIEDVPLSKSMEYFLSSAHWMDAFTPPLRKHLDGLVQRVAAMISAEAAVAPRPVPAGPAPAVGRSVTGRATILGGLLLGALVLGVATWLAVSRRHAVPPVEDVTSRNPAVQAADSTGAGTAPARPSWLGISRTVLPACVAEHLGATAGAIGVSEVFADGPAARAGVQRDDVLMTFDGQPVPDAKAFEGLKIPELPAGGTHTLKVLRASRPVELTVTIQPRPPASGEEAGHERMMFETRHLGGAGLIKGLQLQGDFLAWRGPDGDPNLVICNVASGSVPVPWLYGRRVSAAALLPGGRQIVFAGPEDELALCDTATGEVVRHFETTPGTSFRRCQVSRQGDVVATLSDDNAKAVLETWDVATGTRRSRWNLSDIAGRSEFGGGLYISGDSAELGPFSPSGRYVSIGKGDISVWDVTTGKPAWWWKPQARTTSWAFSPSWKACAVASEKGIIEIVSPATNGVEQRLRGHVGGGGLWSGADCIVWHGEKLLASASNGDRTARIWRLPDAKQIWEYRIEESPNKAFFFGPEAIVFDPVKPRAWTGVNCVREFEIPCCEAGAWAVTEPDTEAMDFAALAPPAARQNTTVSSITSSITVTLPGGSTREIGEAEDGSKMVTERDPAGNVGRMTFVPAPGSVPLGIVFAPAAGGDVDLNELPKIEEGIRVRELAAGGQAARDGVVRPGDLVTAVGVDDTAKPTPIAGLRYAEVQRLLAGKEGSTVRLRIVRDGEPAPLDVVAKRGKVQAVRRKAARSDFTNSIGMEFVAVRGGRGALGVESGDPDVRPHYVRLSKGYLVGAHEVTQAEYTAVMAAQPSAFSPGGEKAEAVTKAFAERDIPFADTAHHPVESVTWDDACEFCRRLGEREGRTYRLPTEAEWEWACRNAGATAWRGGGLSGPWIDETAVGTHLGHPTTTHPVSTRSPNDAGAYDMFGNVAEWCADRFAEDGFVTAKYIDPQGPAEGLKRVVRGGAFTDFGFKFFKRSGLGPAERRPYIGFRVVLEPTRGLLADTAVEAELLDTSAWAVDESRIPNPIPQPDPPLRDAAEEAAEIAAVQETLQSGGALRELRKRLVVSAAANQREFANLRGPWLDVNTRLGNMKTQQAMDLYNEAHGQEPNPLRAVVLERARAIDSLLGWVPNDIAWALATEPDPDRRDPPVAVRRAIEACEETKWRYWGFLDTLAAALAADGRFEQAVRLGEAALERAPEVEREQLEFALERYQRGEAWAEKQP
jgi:formylglycine-generating enzyme required for sulfatase activity